MKRDKVLYSRAITFAKNKHKNQTDKSGKEYIMHCIQVSNYASVSDSKSDDYGKYFEATVGVLHDVLEDTNTTFDELVESFGQSVAEHVRVLTRNKDEPYMDYIGRVKMNAITREIKKRDLLHNLDLSRLNEITKDDIQRNKKYLKALEKLIE